MDQVQKCLMMLKVHSVPICFCSKFDNKHAKLINTLKDNYIEHYHVTDTSKDNIHNIISFCNTKPYTDSVKLLIADFTNGISDITQDAYLNICENRSDYLKIIILSNDSSDISEPLLSRLYAITDNYDDTVINSDFNKVKNFILKEKNNVYMYPVPSIVKSIPYGMNYDKRQLVSIIKSVADEFASLSLFKLSIMSYNFASRLEKDLYTKTELMWIDYSLSMIDNG